ncbi:MAG: GDSL-type esterase/lipase family protein [Lachnospiraceae bacterium]|nr:GDSL-type esterase/lipase family protein [Lachnospiraceae bacterium]MDD7627878.1 GDSL-type esterase/lipase family protein [Lachnospiraceae bacterium]MDY4118836.1 GDSL-type esterase/lipase family protein [Lachnospiraceae bacterium]
MNKVNRFLLMLIAMAAIMLMAVGVDKGMKFYEHKKWESEREVYYEEARTDIAKMQATLQTLSEDQEALVSYLEEYELNEQASDNSISENRTEDMSVSDNNAFSDQFFGNQVSENDVSGNTISGNQISGNEIDGQVSGNEVSGNQISGNGLGNTVSGNSVSGNSLQKEICASYEETIRINHEDKKIIAENTIDFSDKKIACLGDSITAATNLEGQENYLEMSYPYQLGKVLNAGEMVNLGIGGSSIGRYWDNAFVDRYKEIPEDSDIIIVMGGTNDGFCASEKELGSLQEREKRTFAGDLDELLKGLKKDYPDAEIVLVTPLPNILHDMLRRDRKDLLPQSSFVAIMKQLSEEYEIPVIDLYGSGILDSHDAAVIHSFIPDGVHGNEMGYRYLAEHIAAELIRIEEAKAESGIEE